MGQDQKQHLLSDDPGERARQEHHELLASTQRLVKELEELVASAKALVERQRDLKQGIARDREKRRKK
ncbi:MAG: hypothetical protein ACT4P3_09955 [Betaproteobacteria bacterium]